MSQSVHLCRLLRGEAGAEGGDMGPEMQQHLQGRIDLYLADTQAELGIKLDSMMVVQAGERHLIGLQKRNHGCYPAFAMQSQGHVAP